MVNAITRIKCGQIFILPNNNFVLMCGFCGRDICYELKDFQDHIKEHFPESDDDDDDSDCEYVPPVSEVQSVSILQTDVACCSQTTAAPENLLIEREWVPSRSNIEISDRSTEREQSVRNNERKRKHKKRTLPLISSENDNISEVNVEMGEHSTKISAKSLRKRQSVNYNDNIRSKGAAGSNRLDKRDHTLKEIRCKRTKHRYECRFCHKCFSSNQSRKGHENMHCSLRLQTLSQGISKKFV